MEMFGGSFHELVERDRAERDRLERGEYL